MGPPESPKDHQHLTTVEFSRLRKSIVAHAGFRRRATLLHDCEKVTDCHSYNPVSTANECEILYQTISTRTEDYVGFANSAKLHMKLNGNDEAKCVKHCKLGKGFECHVTQVESQLLKEQTRSERRAFLRTMFTSIKEPDQKNPKTDVIVEQRLM
ncbi:hypothetical protein F2P81_009893 [Scophthalmus maximus]|uniref:Uncharacterized protein n=1 Tax=Scophthalmus maximus TaxID=52904 RepID=A0A6A4SWE3_SCOMX|nr:hypothetical protein F2P81_009893 [Scophthalmus maximus]